MLIIMTAADRRPWRPKPPTKSGGNILIDNRPPPIGPAAKGGTTGLPRDARERGSIATVSKALVEAAINNAEPEFEWCLKALAPLGGHGPVEDFGGAIISFQLRLLEAITGLESVYRNIKQEEKRLIAAKARLNELWFRRRMAKLAFYTKALTQVLAIGRAIGDGFAWFFYEAHRDLIDEHLKHQRQPLLPPRIGGLGEKLMLQHLPVIDGKLLLYHGITTFLRIGDFTLIDGKDFSIAAIGELKTSEAGEGRIESQVALVSHDRTTLPQIPSTTSKEKEPRAELTPAMRQRRNKQIRMMHAALASAARYKEAPLEARLNEFYFDKLEEVISRATERRFEWIKAGDGLMIGAVRLPRRGSKKLSDIVLGRSKARVEHLAADAPAQAMKIVNEDRRLNSLFLGSLCSDPLDFVAPKQSFPVALWPIAPSVLSDLLLQRVLVITMLTRFRSGSDWSGKVTSSRSTEKATC